MIKLVCPISITLGKKVYHLNLNNYRNWHYQVSNNLKREFKEIMRSQLEGLKSIQGRVCIKYTLFVSSKRRLDLRNITTVVDKFLCDALQEYKIIPDDNYNICCMFIDRFGGIDKNNPRIEVTIYGI